jgi:hypothetical protein
MLLAMSPPNDNDVFAQLRLLPSILLKVQKTNNFFGELNVSQIYTQLMYLSNLPAYNFILSLLVVIRRKYIHAGGLFS